MRTSADVDHLVPRLDGEFPKLLSEPRHQIGCGIDVIDKDIKTTLLLAHSIKERRYLLIVMVVTSNGDPVSAQLVDLRCGLADGARNWTSINGSTSDIDNEARCSKFEGNPLADATACSSYNSNALITHETPPLGR